MYQADTVRIERFPSLPSTVRMQLTETAKEVLKKRYLRKSTDGEVIESPEELVDRVAKTIAAVDAKYGDFEVGETYEKFFYQIADLKFLPNSPTLMNAGKSKHVKKNKDARIGQLSACFVLPVEDSIESIFDSIKYAALIHKSGGGTGFSFSKLRPKGAAVLSTDGVASGPVSFMKVFDSATEEIKQGGVRRGANMGILNIHHPDIEEFIDCKQVEGILKNFNISVAVTKAFMKAVIDDSEYDIIDPVSGQVVSKKSAREVFDKVVKSAWKNGEPGVIFIDRINDCNPVPHLGRIEATNPCGEQPLLPYESCNLGSINLAKFVSGGRVDYDSLRETVRTAVHFLDNVIDANEYPLDLIRDKTLQTRKIGLGVMGFADFLIAQGIPYDSKSAVNAAEGVMEFIAVEARKMSSELAKTRGSFPAFEGSVLSQNGLSNYMRNATVTTIAPTGSISMIAGVSSGIEPLFSVSYVKKVLDGRELRVTDPFFEEALDKLGVDKQLVYQKVDKAGGTVRNVEELPEEVRRVFVTAHEIDVDWHLKIQAAFQRYTDNAVSKTINFKTDATEDDVREAYIRAYGLGLKGLTVYRDGSRKEQVVYTSTSKDSGQCHLVSPRKRPDVTYGMTKRVRTGCGTLYVTVNSDDNGVCEVFSQMGKAGNCASCTLEAVSRLASLALRSGVNPEEVIRQLSGIRCPSGAWHNGRQIHSCVDAVAYSMSEAIGTDYDVVKDKGSSLMTCPECGATMVSESGCFNCYSCGYSKCG